MLQKFVTALIGLPIVLLVLLSFLGFLSQFDNICEITSHFRIVYLCCAIVCCLAAALSRRMRLCATACLAACINLFLILPYYFPASQDPIAAEAPHIKILQANIWGGKNDKRNLVLDNIKKVDPDIITFSEITGSWQLFLDQELKNYPYRKAERQYGGIAVYSRLPLSDVQLKYFGHIKRPRIITKVKVKESEFVLIAAHTVIPNPRYFAIRNGELAAIADDAARSTLPVIVAGDLNCTPWSFYFQKLLTDGNLRDAEVGNGLKLSWHAAPFIPLLPIDHFLVSQRIVVLKLSTLVYDGSDHLPVFMECAITEPARVIDKASKKSSIKLP